MFKGETGISLLAHDTAKDSTRCTRVALHMLLAGCPGQQGDGVKTESIRLAVNVPPFLTMSHVSVSITDSFLIGNIHNV